MAFRLNINSKINTGINVAKLYTAINCYIHCIVAMSLLVSMYYFKFKQTGYKSVGVYQQCIFSVIITSFDTKKQRLKPIYLHAIDYAIHFPPQ